MIMVLGSSFVGCTTNKNVVQPSTTQKAEVAQGKLQYSNLVDTKTQQEVKQRLIAAGIDKEDADTFMKWVKSYNKEVGQISAFKEGFTTVDGPQVNYDDVNLEIEEQAGENYLQKGTSSRMAAYLLFEDLIDIDSYDQAADSYLMADVEAINHDATYKMLKDEREEYITLFNPVEVQAGTDIAGEIAQIQAAWQKKGITFKEDAKASLITLFLQDPDVNRRFVAHAGVLIEDEEGLLFVEKYAPTLPYQVTKFNSEQDLVDYLLSMTDSYGDETVAAPIVMKNARSISTVEA